MPDDAPILPPPPLPGQRHTPASAAQVINYLEGLMYECYEVRREFDEQADANNNLHRGRVHMRAPKDGVVLADLNRVRNVDIAHIQVQTEETPRVKLTARETGEPGKAYLDGRVDLGKLSGGVLVTLQQLAPDALPSAGNAPLSDDDRARIQGAIDAGLLPADVMIVVTDRVKAEAEQAVFDKKWEDCRADFYLREAAFKKTIIGWGFLNYGFDDRTKNHRLWNPSHLQVFLDMACTDIADASHSELLQFMDLRRAQATWPDYSKDLAKGAIAAGAAGMDFGYPFRIPEIYRRTNFRRAMVPVRHGWIRDYPFPLDFDVAVTQGAIVNQPEVVAPAQLDENGVELVPAQTRDRFVRADDGAQVHPDLPMGTPPREIVDALNTGPDTRPQFAPHPTEPAIREICAVGDAVIYDRRSEYSEFPLVHFVDLPILDSPMGEGQPEALEALQLLINAILSDIATHFKFFGEPSMAVLSEVAQRMPGFSAGVYAVPHGQIWEVPKDIADKVQDLAKLVTFIEPPQLPADFWRFFDLLLSLIDKEGQVTEALEGEGKAHWSGEMVGRLQEAARGLIAWKSLRMEESIKALVKHMLHSQRTRMSVEDYMAVCSKYPPAVWQEIKARPAQLDVSVEIVSGTGQLAERGKQEAMELWNNGQGPLSGDTLLERFGEDPKVESQNQVAAAERTAKAQRAIQAVAGVLQAAPTVGAPNNAPVPPAPVDQPAPDLAPAA